MTTRPNRRRGHQGISLLETVIYLAILGVILSLCYAALYRATDTTKQLGRSAADVARALRAGERWREDIRSATGSIQLDTTTNRMTLNIPKSGGLVRYRFENNVCWREVEGRPEPEKFLDHVRNSECVRERRPTLVCWRWELELESSRTNKTVKPLFTFLAPEPSQHRLP